MEHLWLLTVRCRISLFPFRRRIINEGSALILLENDWEVRLLQRSSPFHKFLSSSQGWIVTMHTLSLPLTLTVIDPNFSLRFQTDNQLSRFLVHRAQCEYSLTIRLSYCRDFWKLCRKHCTSGKLKRFKSCSALESIRTTNPARLFRIRLSRAT